MSGTDKRYDARSMPGTDLGYAARPCPTVSAAISLRAACYAMSGTDLAHDRISLRVCHPMFGTDLGALAARSVPCSDSALRMCYAMFGTDLAYGATSLGGGCAGVRRGACGVERRQVPSSSLIAAVAAAVDDYLYNVEFVVTLQSLQKEHKVGFDLALGPAGRRLVPTLRARRRFRRISPPACLRP
eukprot:765053-Rhodomonas_salina.2